MIRSKHNRHRNPIQQQIGPQSWRIVRPYSYEWIYEDRLRRIIIPQGFEHDGASVPRIIWPFISPWSLRAGAVVHDFLYRFAGDLPEGSFQLRHAESGTTFWKDHHVQWSRRDADRIMCRIARELSVPCWQRRTAYLGVRLFGYFSWGAKEPKMTI
jgi:hypothetical protein